MDKCKNDHVFVQRPRSKSGECHICYKLYQRKAAITRYLAAKEYLVQYKINKGCAICGYKKHHAALELDHIVPVGNKRRYFAAMTSISSLVKYINDPNIQLLCANCHRIKTFTNKDFLKRENV